MASASSHGSQPPRPPTASQPPTGATAIASPRNSCVQVVYRFASEYQNTIASATGDSAKQIGFSRQAAETKTATTTTTNAAASLTLMAPRGSLAVRRSRIQRVEPRVHEAVESHRRASRRDHRHAESSRPSPTSTGACRAASSAPASANGSANTEWLKRTNDR